jgi:hypothetical protein
MSLKRATLVAGLAFFFCLPDAFCVRTSYFSVSATSNFTIDMTSFATKGNTTSNGTFGFQPGIFGCRIFIYNPGPTPQVIGAGSYVDQVLEFPNSTANWSLSVQNPFNDTGGGTITHQPVVAGITNVNTFNFSSGGANTNAVGLPRTLNTGAGLVLESNIIPAFNATYSNGWLTNPPGSMYPWAKLHHTCTGMIQVSDAAGATPGFVVASGEQDYLSSSYQNQPLIAGGNLRRGDNTLSVPPHTLNWQKNGGTVEDTLQGQIAGYCSSAEVFDASNCSGCSGCAGGCGPGSSNFSIYAATVGDASCSCECSVDLAVDNTNSRSSFYPTSMHAVPIIINGGAPL